MSRQEDLGVEIVREAMKDFQDTLAFYENNPDPNPRAGPTGGVALPGMGRGPERPGRPARPTRPGPPARGGPTGRSRPELDRLRKEAERQAVIAMLEARADFIPGLFTRDTRLVYKKGKSPAAEARKEVQKVARAVAKTGNRARKQAAKGRSWTPSAEPAKEVDAESVKEAGGLGRDLFVHLGEVDPTELKELEGIIVELAGDVFTDLGSSLLPLVGTAKAVGRAGSRWTRTAAAQKKVSDTRQARQRVVQGDPEQAVAAVQRLLERERNLLAAEAGMATAKVGVDVAGYFVDLGIATGASASLVEAGTRLALHIRLVIRDARERRDAQALLTGGKLDADLFHTCPILGAYAVAASDTSALVGFLGGDPQRLGYTLDDLDRLVKKYQQPLVKTATEVIAKHRLEVHGMTTDLAQARKTAHNRKKITVGNVARKLKQKMQSKLPRR